MRYTSFITHIYKVSSTKGYHSLKTHFSESMGWSFQPHFSITHQPFIHSSIFQVTLLPLFASVTLFLVPSVCHFSICSLTELSLCTHSELISLNSICASKDGSESQVTGGLSKPHFNRPSFSPYVLLWALSAITGQYLAKWNDLSPPSLWIRPGVCGIHLVYF